MEERRGTAVRGLLTGTGDHGDVTQQAQDLGAEERTVPNVEELVEEALGAGEALLRWEEKQNISISNEHLTVASFINEQ